MSFKPLHIVRPYGFGAVPTDADIAAGWNAINRATALPNYAALYSANNYNNSFFNAINNLRNTLNSYQAGTLTNVADQTEAIIAWTNALNAAVPAGAPAAVAPDVASQHPDVAAVVAHFYDRYLHRTGVQVDRDGLNYWVNVALDGPSLRYADVERGFRVQAVNDGVFTEAALPAPEYFTVSPVTTGGGTDSGGGDTGAGGDDGEVPVYNGGVVGKVESAIGGLFDKISESTGVDKKYLEIGAVVVGLGALAYLNSGPSGRKR